MPLAGVIDNVENGRRTKIISVTFTTSGNYSTNGDTADLTALSNSNSFPAAKAYSRLPVVVKITQVTGGYEAQWITGTTLANGKLKAFSTGGTEVTGGAGYPAGLTTIKADFVFKTNL